MQPDRPIIIGVTGSMAMGKSEVTGQFAALGASTCNSDKIVHQLLGKGGAAVAEVAGHFPSAVKDGVVDRKALGAIVFADPQQRKLLESILHPLVAAEENRFVAQEKQRGAHTIVLDIPLLYETGAEKRCHYTVVVTAPYFIQKRRALRREGMTGEKFKAILSQQMPDAHKRARADFVVQTGLGRAYSMWQVKAIMRKIHAA